MIIKYEDIENKIKYFVMYKNSSNCINYYSGFIIRPLFDKYDIIFKYYPNRTIRDLWRL